MQDSDQVPETAEGVTSLRIGKDLFVKTDPDSFFNIYDMSFDQFMAQKGYPFYKKL